MPRYLDLQCTNCGVEVTDFFVMSVPARIIHQECGGLFEIVYKTRPIQPALESNLAVVFRDAQGKIRYPGKNNLPTPAGYERIVIRPQEIDRFCKEHKVMHEDSNFNRGSGGYDGNV